MPEPLSVPRTRRSAAEMERVLDDLERSDLSHRAFAEDRGIPLSTITWWRRRLGRSAKRRSAAAALVPVVLGEDSGGRGSLLATGTSADGFEVRLRSGDQVFVPAGFDAEALQRVVSVLNASC